MQSLHEIATSRRDVNDATLIVKLPREYKSAVVAVAKEEKTTMAVIVREAIQEYMDRRGQ